MQDDTNNYARFVLCHGIIFCPNPVAILPCEIKTRRELMNSPFPLPLLRKSGSIQLCYFQSRDTKIPSARHPAPSHSRPPLFYIRRPRRLSPLRFHFHHHPSRRKTKNRSRSELWCAN
jgi:hypothetical protein